MGLIGYINVIPKVYSYSYRSICIVIYNNYSSSRYKRLKVKRVKERVVKVA